MRDILSKLNPFSHLFSGNGTTAVPPTSAQAAGVAVLTTTLITVLALSNGAFQNIINFFSGLGHGSTPTALPNSGIKSPETANELWEIIKNGGPEFENLKLTIQQQRLANLVRGTALPEMIDTVGAPPTHEENNDALRRAKDQMTGTESENNWIDIREILDAGTTVKAVIVGTLASILNISWPWAVAIGVATGLTDKFIPDTYSIVAPFYQAEKPDSGLPEEDGIVWTEIPPERFPQLKKEDLWKLPRNVRIKIWQDSHTWFGNMLGNSTPPTTIEQWETRYAQANRSVTEYEKLGQKDPNYLETDEYKRRRFQRDLLNTLRPSGPKMELQ